MEEDTGKEKKNVEEDMGKEKDDPTGVGAMLSFLHTAKLKANSSLQGDSWMYNELMTLKKELEKCNKTRILIGLRSFRWKFKLAIS